MAGRGREVIRASVDGFHHPRAHRYRQGSDSPTGCYEDTFDYSAVRRLLLEPLGPSGSRRYRRACFDFRTDTAVREPAATADPDAILLFDGVFLQRPELAGPVGSAHLRDRPVRGRAPAGSLAQRRPRGHRCGRRDRASLPGPVHPGPADCYFAGCAPARKRRPGRRERRSRAPRAGERAAQG